MVSCDLQIMTLLLLHFQFECCLLLLLVWLLWLNRLLCLVPDLKRNTCIFLPIEMSLTVGLSYTAIIMLRYVPFIPTLLRILIINECCFLPDAFSASINMIMWILSFILFTWCVTFIDLPILYPPCVSRINPSWLWYVMFLMYCYIQLANILLRILVSVFIRDIGL